LAAHRRAAALRPDLVMAYVNISFVAQQLGLLDDAAAAARHAIELDPNEVGGHQNLAATLQDQGQLDAALKSFAVAVRLLRTRAEATAATNPIRATADRQLADVLSMVSVSLLPPIYDSAEEIDRWRQRLIDGLAALKSAGTRVQIPHEPAPTLFTLAYQGRDDVAINRDFAALIDPPPNAPLPPPSVAGAKIRVGFISRFFRTHTIGRLNMGLIDQLDRDQFSAHVFQVGDPQDEVAQFIRGR